MRLVFYFVFVLHLCTFVDGRVGLFVGSHLAVHKNTKSIRKPNMKSDFTSSSATISIPVVDKIAESVVGRQKTMQLVQQIVLSAGSWYLSRQVYALDFTNKSVLQASRVAFAIYILICQLLQKLVIRAINTKNDSSVIEHAVDSNTPNFAMTTKEYDIQEANKVFSSLLTELLIVFFVHNVWRWNIPLLLAPLSLFSSKWQSPVVQVNLLGLQPVGALKRPYSSGMSSFLASLSSSNDTPTSSDETKDVVSDDENDGDDINSVSDSDKVDDIDGNDDDDDEGDEGEIDHDFATTDNSNKHSQSADNVEEEEDTDVDVIDDIEVEEDEFEDDDVQE